MIEYLTRVSRLQSLRRVDRKKSSSARQVVDGEAASTVLRGDHLAEVGLGIVRRNNKKSIRSVPCHVAGWKNAARNDAYG